ncbi:MAG: nitroreductase family deazaflavin-dependent oxidoreductase [Lacisediminihabitans sp.]
MARSYQLRSGRRAANFVVSAMIRLGVGFTSSYLLTTTGRKTLAARTTPVTVLEIDGDRWLVSPYGMVGWVRNVRALPEVTLRRGHAVEAFCAREVGAETAGPVLRDYVSRVPITAPYFDAKPDDPVASFVKEAARHPVFRLEPKPLR